MDKLTFSVDRVKLIEDISNSQFARARVWAFASGDNLHNMPVGEESLMRAEESIYDKPLVWVYDRFEDDAGGHSKFEVPAGFVPKHSANISYERADDGRLFFVCDVLIWKYYSGKLLEIFEKADGEKSVSVEIQILDSKDLDDGKIEIVDYVYLAITVVGEKYSSMIPLANAQIIQFSQDKLEVEKILDFKEKEEDIVKYNKEVFAQSFSETANKKWEALFNAEEIKSEDLKELAKEIMSKEFGELKNDVEGLQEQISALENEKNELTEKFSMLESEKEEISTKFAEKETELNTIKEENAQLLEFKSNVEEDERKNKIEFAINSVAEDLTQEQIDEWRGKVEEFSSIDEFSNAIAAFAYKESKGKNKTGDGIVRMGLPNNQSNKGNENKTLWERI